MELLPTETEIRGFWIDLGSSMVPDATWERINHLINNYLQPTGTPDRYTDPADGRVWELVRPNAHLKDNGPPVLRCLS